MKHIALLGSAALVLLAFPSEGWSRKGRLQCQTDQVRRLVANWADALNKSSSTNPAPILTTYAPKGAVLLPTCANGPLTNEEDIKKYFVDFLKKQPRVTVDPNKAAIGGCDYTFASGLYEFALNGQPTPILLRARYTYVFHNGKIMQHHSSVEPDVGPGNVCPPKNPGS
jgi:hypothetical protein